MTVKRVLLQEDAGVVNAMRYAASPSALNSATLTAAIAAIGSTPTTLLLQPGTWSLTSSVAVPATCTLWRSSGTLLALGGGTVLTLASPIRSDDPTEQYFSGTGTVTFTSAAGVEVRPQWWGAVADGSTDDSAAFNAMMASLNSTGGGSAYVPAGTYAITTSIRVPSNTLVTGAGAKTIIKMGVYGVQGDCAFENWGFDTSATNVNITLQDFVIDGSRATPAGAFMTYEANIWNPSTAYLAGTYTANTINGFRIYLCITSGTSAASGGPTTTAADITDGSAHWQYVEDLWTSTHDPTGHEGGINMSRVTNLTIDNVSVYMCRDDGIICELCYGATVTNCHFADINKNAVYFSDNEHSICANNYVEAAFGGLAFACEWYSTMTGNTGRQCLNYFISAGRDTQFCTIVGNNGGNSDVGFGTGGGDFLSIAESITGTTHGKTYHVPYDDYRYGCYQCVVANNVFSRIQLHLSSRNIVLGNQIQNARRDGIHVLGSSQNLIALNVVYNGGTATFPWAFGNFASTGGALDGTVESVQNWFLANQVYDDRQNDGLQRWGFTFTGNSVGIHVIGNMVNLDDSVSIPARFYNWNVDYGVFKENYYNAIFKFLPTSTPTARAELRGDIWTLNQGAGIADESKLCIKNASDTYEFINIAQGGFRVIGVGSATWDMSDTGDKNSNSTNVNVVGAVAGDLVLCTYSSVAAAGNVLISGTVQSANTVRVVVLNETGGAYDPPSGTVTAIVLRLL